MNTSKRWKTLRRKNPLKKPTTKPWLELRGSPQKSSLQGKSNKLFKMVFHILGLGDLLALGLPIQRISCLVLTIRNVILGEEGIADCSSALLPSKSHPACPNPNTGEEQSTVCLPESGLRMLGCSDSTLLCTWGFYECTAVRGQFAFALGTSADSMSPGPGAWLLRPH